jgi:uncharacterized protein (DUF1330 family)
MPAYIVVDIDVKDSKTYDRYKRLAPATMIPYGGRYLTRGGETAVLEGEWTPKRFVILEFPSLERAKAWWSSAEYAEPKKMRQASARTNMVATDGLPPGVKLP